MDALFLVWAPAPQNVCAPAWALILLQKMSGGLESWHTALRVEPHYVVIVFQKLVIDTNLALHFFYCGGTWMNVLVEFNVNVWLSSFWLMPCNWLRGTQASSSNVIVTDTSWRRHNKSLLLTHSGRRCSSVPRKMKGHTLWLCAHCRLESDYFLPTYRDWIWYFFLSVKTCFFDTQRIHRI